MIWMECNGNVDEMGVEDEVPIDMFRRWHRGQVTIAAQDSLASGWWLY